jgi:carbon monoxide dehydrogenase subunit G
MAHAETEITVPRSAPAVYEFLTDLENVPRWIPAVQHVELEKGVAGEPGAEYTATVAAGGGSRSGRLRLESVDPPREMSMRITASPLRIDGRISVADLGDTARVSVVLDAPTGGLLRLMDGVIEQALRDALAQLPRLADAIPPGP